MHLPRWSPRLGWMVLCLATAITRAQDVSLSPLQWMDLKDPPDEMPVAKSRLRTPFPRDLKATPDIGYIIYDVMLDPRGKTLSLNPRPTLTAFLSAEREVAQTWEFSPGKREGKGVNTAVTFAVIFNPASAAASSTDATPRLLEPSLVRLPRPKGTKATEVIPDELATAEIMVDAQGAVTRIIDTPSEIREHVEIAMKNWRFAPARQGGQPVAAKVRVPLVLKTVQDFPSGKPTQPRAIFQARPIYPFAMRASGMRGEVIVDFVVDIEGRVRNAYAIRSLNPSFDDPAVDAVRKWRFEPARVGERPVSIHMQVPIVFTLDGVGGGDGMEVKKKGDLSKLPEEFRYDTAPKLRGSARPVFPHDALAAKREGKAIVNLLIDEKGRVADTRILEASAPEFGQALVAAVAHFEYEPALKNGRPCKALIGFMQEFKRDEVHQLVSDVDLGLLQREVKRPQSIVGLTELDGKLKPLSQRPPKFPSSLQGKIANGEALIEFLVDEDGRARLPRVTSASHELFGYAAVQGVAAWRFEAPTRGGRATVIRVRVPIQFSSPEPLP